MPANALAKTPLHHWHVKHGGRMVDFAGWDMPVQYSSIVDEHHWVRKNVGMFDVSHMGRIQVFGAKSAAFLDSHLTRRVTDMRPGDIRYSLVCNESGGILDDVLVYRLAKDAAAHDDQPIFQLVVNASNRTKIDAHLAAHKKNFGVRLSDLTKMTAMIAVQGPQAIKICDPLVDFELTHLANYRGTYSEVINYACYVSRTGYTGEDGVELIMSENYAQYIWDLLLEQNVPACGLAARDTLRLEAAMPLYGHELSEQINPVQAGLMFAVDLTDRDFIGRDAIAEFKRSNAGPVRVGLELDGKRPARETASVLMDGQEVGRVTSGTFSPTLGKPIAMAYVQPSAASVGRELVVDIRGKQHAAKVVKLPFYKRS